MHPLFPHWRFLGAGSLLVAFSAIGQTFVLSLFGGDWPESSGCRTGSWDSRIPPPRWSASGY